MIAIVDYGMGNVGSIRNMLASVGSEAVITADPAVIRTAAKLILPGVGAFDAGMRHLETLLDVLQEAALERRIPVLGICLGMQLMCKSSEEGQRPGLGWVDAEVKRFAAPPGVAIKIPHMGWNTIKVRKPHPLLSGIEGEQRYYFVHSFHAACRDPQDVLATAHHGYDFDAAFSRENIVGVQFHPEKSHRFGRALMQAFAQL